MFKYREVAKALAWARDENGKELPRVRGKDLIVGNRYSLRFRDSGTNFATVKVIEKTLYGSRLQLQKEDPMTQVLTRRWLSDKGFFIEKKNKEIIVIYSNTFDKNFIAYEIADRRRQMAKARGLSPNKQISKAKHTGFQMQKIF